MNRNQNQMVESKTYHYLLMPGDATAYRFHFSYLDQPSPEKNYVIEDGVGDHGQVAYVQVSIRMGAGTGVTCLSIRQLQDAENQLELLADYAAGHGMKDVDSYTLRAVLLAMGVLVSDPYAVDKAADAMLLVRKLWA